MSWQLTWYLFPVGGAAATAFMIAAVGWYYRDYTSARSLAFLMCAIGWWSLAYLIGIAATNADLKILAYKLMFPAIAVTPVAWLVFTIEYTGRWRLPSRKELAGLLVVPTLTVMLVFTNQTHGLVWASLGVTAHDSLIILSSTKGVWFWAFAAYSYVLVGLGIGSILKTALFSEHVYQDQVIGLSLAVAFPIGGNLLYLIGFSPIYDPTSLGFAASGTVLLAGIFRRQLLQLIPVAREIARQELIDSMEEAVIVVDEHKQVADLNPAAQMLIGTRPDIALGKPIEESFPNIASAVDFDAATTDQVEFSISSHETERHYEVRSVPLKRSYGAITGHLLTIRDITDRYEREQSLQQQRQRLEVLNRVLRHDIRNGMNVIRSHAQQCSPANKGSERSRKAIVTKSEEILGLSEKARQVESLMNGSETPTALVDVVEVINQYITTIETDYPNAEISIDAPDSACVTTTELVNFAIRNVLENALEHNDQDQQIVDISITNLHSSCNGVIIQIADNGPGLPPQERTVLNAGHETALRHSDGLGLWLVNWIIEESDGDFRITDNDPRGTVITLRIPELEATAESEFVEQCISTDYTGGQK